MKKRIYLSLAACSLLAISGCSSSNTTESNNAQTNESTNVSEESTEAALTDAKPLEINDKVFSFSLFDDMPDFTPQYTSVIEFTNPNDDYYINNFGIDYKMKDSEGKVITSGGVLAPTVIGPGETVMGLLTGIQSDLDTSDYTFSFKIDEDNIEYIPADQLKDFSFSVSNVEYSQPANNSITITADITNNSEFDELPCFYEVIPYKNEQPVFFIYNFAPDLDKGETAVVSLENYACPDFDKVVVKAYPMYIPDIDNE